MSEEKPSSSFDCIVGYAMQLSLMEVGLGSFLHAFRIPFSGFFLSLNQCFVLNRSLLFAPTKVSKTLPMTISNTAAIIKTLSPFGKKMTPMLAISMQGLLFNLGVLLFGKNLFGRCLGSILLGLWPMVQPALIYGLIYGSMIFEMSTYYNQVIAKISGLSEMTIELVVAGYVFVHLFLSVLVCLLTSFVPIRILDRYDQYMTAYKPFPLNTSHTKSTFTQKLRGVGKDMTSPFFMLSLILSGIFFYATVNSLELFFFSSYV